MYRIWLVLGGIAGASAVAMAAAAAHALGDLSPALMHATQSGIQMQGWHALALVACGIWAERRGGALAHAAGAAFALGLLLFCAAVYALVFAGLSLGLIAPVGGVLLMLGWLLLGASAWGRRAGRL